MDFNKEFTLSNGCEHYMIAFDPSYICKSKRETPSAGMYWSGCMGKCKWGLEIVGIAVNDVENHSVFHLEAVQTLQEKENEGQTFSDWNVDVLKERKEKLLRISKYLVCDYWFLKKSFVARLILMGLHIVCLLRDDADLKYLNLEASFGKWERQKKYNGKINVNNQDTSYYPLVLEKDEFTAQSAVVFSKALKMDFLLIFFKYHSGKQPLKLFFTTDLELNPKSVITNYKLYFQIEFYCDGKQSTGLKHCQAKSEKKLDFHFNISITAITLPKVKDWFSLKRDVRPPFSKTSIETVNHNKLLLKRFFDVFDISANIAKEINISKISYYSILWWLNYVLINIMF